MLPTRTGNWPGGSETCWRGPAVGRSDHVDATVVAVAVSRGGGVILTGDPRDLAALADGLVGISVEPIH